MVRVKGSMSAFGAILFGGLLLLFSALLISGRARMVKTGIVKDADFSMDALLGEYEKEWVEAYGLYMIPKDRLESGAAFYLENNCSHSFYGYSLEHLEVTPQDTLYDPQVLLQEIEGFMEWRGAVEAAELLATLLEEVEEKGLAEAELFEKGAEEMAYAQELYSGLITCIYGVREDGGVNPYPIHTFLSASPTKAQLEMAAKELIEFATALEKVDEETPAGAELPEEGEEEAGESAPTPVFSAESLSLLENGLQKAMDVEKALLDAKALGQELAIFMDEQALREEPSVYYQGEGREKGEEDAPALELPITKETLEKALRVFEANQKPVQKLKKAMETMLEAISEEGHLSEVKKAKTAMQEAFSEYDPDLYFPYEYRPGKGTRDFRKLLYRLQGYSFDMDVAAPDTELPFAGFRGESEMAQEPVMSVKVSPSSQLQLILYLSGMLRNFRENVAQREGEKPVNLRGDEKKPRFFQNEIEYLIGGRANEYHNVSAVRNRILAIRLAMNMAYLLTDQEKSASLHALAAATGGILFPGTGEIVAYYLLATIWSLGESIEDYRALTEGGKVALWKSEDTWRTDIDKLLSGELDSDHSGERGLSYSDYLAILLSLQDPSLTLSRFQDLLFVNHSGFALQEAVVSFTLTSTAWAPSLGSISFGGTYGYYLKNEKE